MGRRRASKSGDRDHMTPPVTQDAQSAASPPVVVLCTDGTLVAANRSAGVLFVSDAGADAWVGQFIWRLLAASPASTDDRWRAAIAAALRGEDVRSPILNGSVRSVQGTGEPLIVVSFGVDAAAGRMQRVEESSDEKDEQYRRLFLSNPAPMWIFDVATLRFLEVNDAAVAQYGYTRQEFLALTLRDIRPPDLEDQQALDRGLAALSPLRPLTQPTAHRHRRADGAIIDVEIASHAITWQGRVARLVMSTDITERVHAQADRGRLAAIVQSSTDAIMSVTRGAITSWNPAAEAMFGHRAEQAIGQLGTLIVPTAAFEKAGRMTKGILGGAILRDYEAVLQRRDGTTFPAAVSAFLVPTAEDGPTVSAIIRDLSGQRELEAQLRHSRRMEAMGRLAGGVAHDFNNLLTVIKMGAELALDGVPPNSDARADIQEIVRATERAAVLTRQLLAFGRTDVVQIGALDLGRVLHQTKGLLRRVLGADVELRVEVAAGTPPIRGDTGQLEQVILNLALNARDAMPAGGCLTLTVEPHAAASLPAHLRGQTTGAGVLMTVADTGVGMDSDTASRCFEPFFSTKEPGKGSGLGLPMVYGITRQSSGIVWVESAPGEGTRFRFWFPATAEQPREATTTSGAASTLDAPTGSVLLVEDAAPIRALAERLLTGRGFTVHSAADGEDALALWNAYQSSIVALVTDIQMPRLGGRELAARLRAERPELPVVYISGFVDGGDVPTTDLARATVFLEKPFTLEGLVNALSLVLRGPAE